MKTTGLIFSVCVAFLSMPIIASSDEGAAGMVLTPGEIEWLPSSRDPGFGLAKLNGDIKRHGPYVYRIRIPPGRVVRAHHHPDDRYCTVLSGTFYLGWGDAYDPEKLMALPAGSFYAEPAGVPHFGATPSGEVVLQVTGSGPTAVYYVDPAVARSD